MARAIHHIAVNVRDLDRMVRFYCDALGFEQHSEAGSWENRPLFDHILDVKGSAARACILRAGNCYLEVFQFTSPPPQSDRPLRPFDRGYTHLCIDVTDIENDMKHFIQCGMTFNERELAAVDLAKVRTLYGYDPEGNVVEIQQCLPGCDIALGHLDIFKGAAKEP